MARATLNDVVSELQNIDESITDLDDDFIIFYDEQVAQNILLNEKLILYAENDILRQENEIVLQEKIDNLQYQIDQAITFQSYNFIFFGVIVAVLFVMLLFRGFKIRS